MSPTGRSARAGASGGTAEGITPDELADAARAAGLAAGLDAVGITDVSPLDSTRRDLEARRAAGQHAGMSFTFSDPVRSTEPARLLRRARSMVVGARGYLEPRPARPPGAQAAVARYAWRDHYAELRSALDAVAEVLRDAGHRAAVVADQNGLVDRAAAHRAGLGWWGRNANLLLPEGGSWFVLGAVVTDAELPAATEVVPDGCRTCRRCAPACPTGAIVADGVIDARRCLAWLVQDVGVLPRAHRIALGDRIYGCDDCQDVCPPGRGDVRAVDAAPPAAARSTAVEVAAARGPHRPGNRRPDGGPAPGDPPQAWIDVLGLLELPDDELLHEVGRWYVPRREPRYVRRNALVVLGNVGDPDDEAHRRALVRWTADDDALLRAHAVWAAARLGHDDLVAARAGDPSPLVRAEVALAPAVPRRGHDETPEARR